MRISSQFEKIHVSVLTLCYEFLADKDPETVRRGNLPNVTEVKRKKKKKQDAHPSLLLAPDFWVWFPNTKIQGSSESTPLPSLPAAPCLIGNRWQHKWWGGSFPCWSEDPLKCLLDFLSSQIHQIFQQTCRLPTQRWQWSLSQLEEVLFITLFKCHLPLWGPREARYWTYELISSHEWRPQSKGMRQRRFLASPAELSREPLKTPGSKSKNQPPPEDKNGS